MLLEIEGLNAHYGRIHALKSASLTVGEGELVALVGANGAGKTTLLRTLSGVHPATSGTIKFEGRDITRMPAHQRVAEGLIQVPEGRQLFGPQSVEDNLRLGAYRRGGNPERDLEELYAMFPVLKVKRDQPAGTLSGGQQQMVAIGRALMAKPRVLLLDEPSMGLAPLLVGEIFNAVERLKEQGTTILLVEQNAYAALAIADRGYVIETGEITLHDSGSALLANERVKQAYLGL
ncbi:ABC transporter ATP-binding protein [Azospirillum soli]|uniref:ABC transporter ATP-binding protein n=1 Tax=Azospirillum soli TaxID=1304799 RepID=UPI001AEA4C8F|nr:ABC transporter ATP-binding protein [Azospirillum soli]MBP2313559.1 branched-chain amino acid transport system ATP-binding protein [Azospirillum soli]